MTKCIGIISYLPDNNIIREYRINTLKKLIAQCDKIFNLPIIIIAQNWKDADIGSSNCEIFDYDKLGIVGARKELRKVFLNSGVDVLIMLDDDCNIIGDYDSANNYLRELDSHGEAFGEFKGTQLKLFSIHRDILKELDYKDVNPELEEGFEDTVYVEELRKLYPDKRFVFHHYNLEETSSCSRDPNSTWYTNQDLPKMLNRTQKIINEGKK